MLRMLVCCGGGFSSSHMAEKMKKEIIAKQKQDEVYVEFAPFSIACREKIKDFDIMLCCPHLFIAVKNFIKEANPSIPLYLLPPRIYGTMILEEVMQDAYDLIKIYQNTHMNPTHFPGEESVMRIKRAKAYRHEHKDFTI